MLLARLRIERRRRRTALIDTRNHSRRMFRDGYTTRLPFLAAAVAAVDRRRRRRRRRRRAVSLRAEAALVLPPRLVPWPAEGRGNHETLL